MNTPPAPRRRPPKERVLLSWSGGKDSAMAAWHLLAAQRYDIVALLTTVTEGYERISMHGVRRELLQRQAAALGIPLYPVTIPIDCSNEAYEARFGAALAHFAAQGVRQVAFGDIFLEDLRRYRERQLAAHGMSALFPLWQRDTAELVRSFIGLGFRALLCCVDTEALDPAFAGRAIDQALLAELPESADPCGENGEYHSFVHAGPIFSAPIACAAGERVRRTPRFEYCDILPL